MRWPDLADILKPLPWAVIGAVAARLYMPERSTRDLDVVVLAQDAPEARRRLRAAGYSYLGELTIGGSSWTSPDGVPVDLIEGRDPWWPQALAEAAANRDAQGLPVLPLPYLVLTKLLSGRVQDLADITRMLGQADEESLTRVRALIAQHVPDAMEDLESLIALGKLEREGEEGRATSP
ncbi:MAG TPA: hypothetical protein VNL95_08770 [Dehalococcoidia bacterium]|nr:hypothetical protein [Dehalococcoidia bacterium]